MAEGEDPFAYKDPVLDDNLDNDDDEQEVDTTQPFQPGASSTPYYGREQYEMQTMMHEHSGLPDTSYEETPLLGAQAETQNSWDALTRLFPRASAIDLAPVLQRLDKTIHWINHYPADSVVCFVNIYPLDSDLSGG